MLTLLLTEDLTIDGSRQNRQYSSRLIDKLFNKCFTLSYNIESLLFSKIDLVKKRKW